MSSPNNNLLRIAHLYPKHLNLYGDKGNILALKKRLEWRNIPYKIDEIDINEKEKRFSDYNLFFIGGGQDKQQDLVGKDILNRKPEFIDAINNNAVVLAVCGGYQLLGKSFETSDSLKIQGLGILDIETKAVPQIEGRKQDRLIGNICAKIMFQPLTKFIPETIVGFENHSGRTYIINPETKPLFKILYGQGNNGEDDFEGAIYKNVFGTYLHGSLLPKNPHLVDELLYRSLIHADLEKTYKLKPLNDSIESMAHQYALNLK
jgi:lipid II isoglutaminyl synthase (glutamine-hydrolysing)